MSSYGATPSLTFGPVPSRRLGRSLGINNIPPKACSYSCVYCQVGPTKQTEILPRAFFPPESVEDAVRARVERAREAGDTIDYLTFVPDGEPTLDVHLGETIARLRPLEIPIAIITNGSLLWRPEVREVLRTLDWVSVKVDSVDPEVWARINRPDGQLNLSKLLDGISAFATEPRKGELATETMLISGINDHVESVQGVADFLKRIAPDIAYLSIPTRPPASSGVRAPSDQALLRAFQIFSAALPHVEYLTGYEGNAFSSTGDAAQDLLSITAVHPMREEAVQTLLEKGHANWSVVKRLIEEGQLGTTDYAGHRFYFRRASSPLSTPTPSTGLF